MDYKGSELYDLPDFFKKYLAKRQKGNAPNELIELPIIKSLLPDLKKTSILDLGCGDAAIAEWLFDNNIHSYQGIDASEKMLEVAAELNKANGATFSQGDLNELALPKDQFDIVLSRLAFHYVKDLEVLFSEIYSGLKVGGTLIFSAEHPVITSCYDAYHTKSKTKRGSWIVDNYFDSGKRVNQWIEKSVLKYHRTFEEYFEYLQRAGFQITKIRESKPQRMFFNSEEEYQRRMRIPLFLIVKVNKV